MMRETGSVPRLRFPEFRDAGDWEAKPLGDVAPLQRGFDLPTDQIEQGSIPVVYSNGVRNFHSKCMATGPGLVTGRSGTIGKFHFIESGDYWPHNTSLWVTTFNGNFPKFVYYLYKSIGTERFSSGSGVPTLNRNYVHAFNARIPKLPEQQKVADCLTSLDDLITAEAQKLEALKAHKKSLMQQLFPREGETKPRLRFPEFRDAGDWDEKPLGKVATFHSGGTPSKSNPEYWEGSTPWISASSMHEITIGKSDAHITEKAVEDGAQIAAKGTLLLLVRGSMLHKRIPMGIAATEVTYNQDVKALSLKKNVAAEFLLYLLMAAEWDLLNAVTKTGIGAGKLDSSDLNSLPIKIPSPLEQQKITDCLIPLNDLITAQAQKLEALKAHKKGLMQQLFPTSDEVSG